jgi:hypothetical protein
VTGLNPDSRRGWSGVRPGYDRGTTGVLKAYTVWVLLEHLRGSGVLQEYIRVLQEGYSRVLSGNQEYSGYPGFYTGYHTGTKGILGEHPKGARRSTTLRRFPRGSEGVPREDWVLEGYSRG